MEGTSWGLGPVHMLSWRGTVASVLTPNLGPLGIDKLTEKSQVSEDGTLRSLEPVPQQGSADGSPTVEVGLGDPVGGFPFLPGLPRVGQARVP